MNNVIRDRHAGQVRRNLLVSAAALALASGVAGGAEAPAAAGSLVSEQPREVHSHAVPAPHWAQGRAMADAAAAWLRTQQDPTTGGWSLPSPEQGGPTLPAITALVINGLMMQPGVTPDDLAVKRGLNFLYCKQQPDGGIYDVILPSYNTAIALSALARADTREARAAIPAAQEFLRRIQWNETNVITDPGSEKRQIVTPDHPFYGGAGYGRSGRPDLSNLTIMLQGLHDSGVSPDDIAFERALVFLARVQMLDSVNDMPYADGSSQGGFIYSTSENAEKIGLGQSYAGLIEESLDDGTNVSRLRAYGSMTYAGFKSLIYAGLTRDDPRVTAAADWISRNYTLEENPAMGTDGLYYYFLTFARAMRAWMVDPDTGAPIATLDTVTPAGTVEPRDWAKDLIERLARLQQPDGSFRSVDDRWMESNPVLITAFAHLALRYALESEPKR